jgi:hypothetical protein
MLFFSLESYAGIWGTSTHLWVLVWYWKETQKERVKKVGAHISYMNRKKIRI